MCSREKAVNKGLVVEHGQARPLAEIVALIGALVILVIVILVLYFGGHAHAS